VVEVDMEVLGWAVSILFVLAVIAGMVWLGSRLRARSMRRGNYPHRDLPWFLGGTPEMPLDPPADGRAAQARRRK
jgi:hypothetical protein